MSWIFSNNGSDNLLHSSLGLPESPPDHFISSNPSNEHPEVPSVKSDFYLHEKVNVTTVCDSDFVT
jgi:hypothetical protein